MFGLFLILVASSAQAQSSDIIKVNVPFDFQVSGKTLPAGEYTVKRLTEKVVLIQSVDNKTSVVAQAPGRIQAGANDATERLVFHQYGDQYFLSQVWLSRDEDGRELNRSGDERRTAAGENLAMGGKQLRQIEVAASAR
jgi:hypothetical protein